MSPTVLTPVDVEDGGTHTIVSELGDVAPTEAASTPISGQVTDNPVSRALQKAHLAKPASGRLAAGKERKENGRRLRWSVRLLKDERSRRERKQYGTESSKGRGSGICYYADHLYLADGT
jgi:hypothetical protein